MNLDMVVRRLFWKVEIREDKSNEGDKIAFFSNSLFVLCSREPSAGTHASRLREGRPMAIMLQLAGTLITSIS